jgi:formamidopyrimidine-DNA glycosylase
MPELPEVETVRRALEPHLAGARIEKLWTSGLPLRLARPLDVKRLRKASVGRRVVALRRAAKYLLIDTDGTETIVVHLGMTGQLRVVPAGSSRLAHTHVVWTLDGGRELRFVDPRRFGLVAAIREPDEIDELAHLGLDPLGPEMTADRLYELAHATRRAVKVFLLDQRRVAGIGNIYASEALFVAGIHPATPANRLSRARVETLRVGIVTVLERGLRNRGTTLRDYVDADGQAGENQHELAVYGREGQACLRCGGRVRRLTHDARGTFFCPRCQTR